MLQIENFKFKFWVYGKRADVHTFSCHQLIKTFPFWIWHTLNIKFFNENLWFESTQMPSGRMKPESERELITFCLIFRVKRKKNIAKIKTERFSLNLSFCFRSEFILYSVSVWYQNEIKISFFYQTNKSPAMKNTITQCNKSA